MTLRSCGHCPNAAIEPNITLVRAPALWGRGFTGQGIVVGVADTGFQWDHPALKARYRGWNGSSASHGYNWHDAIHDAAAGNPCGSDAPAPCDDDGHGTATSGLSVGDDGEGNQIGVAQHNQPSHIVLKFPNITRPVVIHQNIAQDRRKWNKFRSGVAREEHFS